MSYHEWINDVEQELYKKYKIKELSESNGLEIEFYNNFHYSIEEDELEDLYYFSKSDVMRYSDGVEDICKDIEGKYMDQLRRY